MTKPLKGLKKIPRKERKFRSRRLWFTVLTIFAILFLILNFLEDIVIYLSFAGWFFFGLAVLGFIWPAWGKQRLYSPDVYIPDSTDENLEEPDTKTNTETNAAGNLNKSKSKSKSKFTAKPKHKVDYIETRPEKPSATAWRQKESTIAWISRIWLTQAVMFVIFLGFYAAISNSYLTSGFNIEFSVNDYIYGFLVMPSFLGLQPWSLALFIVLISAVFGYDVKRQKLSTLFTPIAPRAIYKFTGAVIDYFPSLIILVLLLYATVFAIVQALFLINNIFGFPSVQSPEILTLIVITAVFFFFQFSGLMVFLERAVSNSKTMAPYFLYTFIIVMAIMFFIERGAHIFSDVLPVNLFDPVDGFDLEGFSMLILWRNIVMGFLACMGVILGFWLARQSAGRTYREVFLAVLFFPALYLFGFSNVLIFNNSQSSDIGLIMSWFAIFNEFILTFIYTPYYNNILTTAAYGLLLFVLFTSSNVNDYIVQMTPNLSGKRINRYITILIRASFSFVLMLMFYYFLGLYGLDSLFSIGLLVAYSPILFLLILLCFYKITGR